MSNAPKPIGEISESCKVRFWAKVDKNGPLPDPEKYPELKTPCWVWTAATRKGYGEFKIRGKQFKAHRISWTIENIQSPGDLCILHKCDHPPCINPSHLFLGTHADNAKDREVKYRGNHPFGDANGSRKHPERLPRGSAHHLSLHPENILRGESNGFAKLNSAAVLEIRSRRANGETLASLGREFGVSYVAIRFAVSGKTWAHVK